MMNMRTYKILLVAAVTTALAGCMDLDRYPDDKLSNGTFWKSQVHADEAMAGVYSAMQQEYVFGRYFAFDCLGSVCIGESSSHNAICEVFLGTYTAGYMWVNNRYRYLYEGIARAHLVMQNIGKVGLDEVLTNRYIAEARFLRALFYFELANTFGGVPIYDETTVVAESYNEMKKPRNTLEEVYDFIIKDLDFAAQYLPGEGQWGDAMHGRATSNAAIALRGKVHLYRYQYKEASEDFATIISSGKHSLYPVYADLFKPGGDDSSEMIFAIQNLGGVGQTCGMPLAFYLGTRSSFGSDWNSVMPSTSFVDSYECIDGKPFNWDDFIPLFNENDDVKMATFRATLTEGSVSVKEYPANLPALLNMYNQRDPRMGVTVLLPYTMFKGWVNNAPKDCEFVLATGVNETNGFIRLDNGWDQYVFRKFVPEYNMDGLITSRSHTPINFPIIRYADVLLMQAECLNELGHQDEAVCLINEVRSRAGMPGLNSGPDWLKANTKSEIFERIVRERAWEFAAEGLSFWDYKRWNRLERLAGPMKSVIGKTMYTRNVTGRDYLWPIPQNERDRNPNIGKQNPGW